MLSAALGLSPCMKRLQRREPDSQKKRFKKLSNNRGLKFFFLQTFASGGPDTHVSFYEPFFSKIG